jgi:hypothetical protein
MGKGSSSPAPAPSSQTVTQTNLPAWAQPYSEQLLGQAQALTDVNTNPYQQYGGQRLADFTPMQQQAFSNIGGMQPNAAVGAGIGISANAAQQASQYGNYQPQQFGNQYQGQNFNNMGLGYLSANTQNFNNPAIAQSYMSPYTQNVVDIQQREAQRQADVAKTGRNAQAVAAGSFGGSRQAISDAEAARNLATQKGDIQAQGLNTAYNQAQQSFQADQARQLQAQQSNQGAYGQMQGLGMQQNLAGNAQNMQNAQLRAQYGLAGQQAGEQSRQYGANLGMQGLQQQLAAAGQLGALGQSQYNQQMGINAAQQQAGAQQQAFNQQGLTTQYQDYLNKLNYPYQQMSYMSDILHGTPTGGITSAQTSQAAPSVYSQTLGALGGIGSLAGAYAAANRKAGGVIKGYKEGGAVQHFDGGGVAGIPLNPNAQINYTDPSTELSIKNATDMAQKGQPQPIPLDLLRFMQSQLKDLHTPTKNPQSQRPTTVVEDIAEQIVAQRQQQQAPQQEEQAMQGGQNAGIASLSAPVLDQQNTFNAAGGGIIAFDGTNTDVGSQVPKANGDESYSDAGRWLSGIAGSVKDWAGKQKSQQELEAEINKLNTGVFESVNDKERAERLQKQNLFKRAIEHLNQKSSDVAPTTTPVATDKTAPPAGIQSLLSKDNTLNLIAAAESDFKNVPNAGGTSGAYGIYQIVPKTFEGIKTNNPELKDYTWEQFKADPKIQTVFAEKLKQENIGRLKNKNIQDTPLNQYTVWFSGNTRLATSPADNPIGVALSPEQIKANGLEGMTVGQVREKLAANLERGQKVLTSSGVASGTSIAQTPTKNYRPYPENSGIGSLVRGMPTQADADAQANEGNIRTPALDAAAAATAAKQPAPAPATASDLTVAANEPNEPGLLSRKQEQDVLDKILNPTREKPQDFANRIKEEQKAFGIDDSASDKTKLDSLAKMATEAKQNRDVGFWLASSRAFFTIAAQTGPGSQYPLVNFAKGMNVGAEDVEKVMNVYSKTQGDLTKARINMEEARQNRNQKAYDHAKAEADKVESTRERTLGLLLTRSTTARSTAAQKAATNEIAQQRADTARLAQEETARRNRAAERTRIAEIADKYYKNSDGYKALQQQESMLALERAAFDKMPNDASGKAAKAQELSIRQTQLIKAQKALRREAEKHAMGNQANEFVVTEKS